MRALHPVFLIASLVACSSKADAPPSAGSAGSGAATAPTPPAPAAPAARASVTFHDVVGEVDVPDEIKQKAPRIDLTAARVATRTREDGTSTVGKMTFQHTRVVVETCFPTDAPPGTSSHEAGKPVLDAMVPAIKEAMPDALGNRGGHRQEWRDGDWALHISSSFRGVGYEGPCDRERELAVTFRFSLSREVTP